MYVRERNRWKIRENIVNVVYLQVILFRTHERDIATEKEFGMVVQMTLSAHYFRDSTKALDRQQKKLTLTNAYTISATKPGNSTWRIF